MVGASNLSVLNPDYTFSGLSQRNMFKFDATINMLRPLEFKPRGSTIIFYAIFILLSIITNALVIIYNANDFGIFNMITTLPTHDKTLLSSNFPISNHHSSSSSDSSPSSSSTSGGSSSSSSTSPNFRYSNPYGFRCKKNRVVSNMQLVMVWPPGFCNESTKCWPEVQVSKFYIHGLWPADAHGRQKEGCGLLFNLITFPAQLLTLGDVTIRRLYQDYPSYQVYPNSPTQYEASPQFWKHEYLKHGSCAEISFIDYFNRVLEKGANLKIENWLSNAGMLGGTTTSASYTANEFSQAFFPYIGNNHFYLSCIEENRLAEIILCLDEEARDFISCPSSQKNFGCNKESPVTFHRGWTF